MSEAPVVVFFTCLDWYTDRFAGFTEIMISDKKYNSISFFLSNKKSYRDAVRTMYRNCCDRIFWIFATYTINCIDVVYTCIFLKISFW